MSEVPKIQKSAWETTPGKPLQPVRRKRRRRGGGKHDPRKGDAKDDEGHDTGLDGEEIAASGGKEVAPSAREGAAREGGENTEPRRGEDEPGQVIDVEA